MLYFQIIIDVVFFIVIMLLLRQLDKRMAKKPGSDDVIVGEFKKLIMDSRNSTDHFLQAVQESEEHLNNLVRQLDNKEKRIVILIEIAESLIQKMATQQARTEASGSDGDKYEQIIRMVREGLSGENIANRLGVTVGEIDLVMELEQTKACYP